MQAVCIDSLKSLAYIVAHNFQSSGENMNTRSTFLSMRWLVLVAALLGPVCNLWSAQFDSKRNLARKGIASGLENCGDADDLYQAIAKQVSASGTGISSSAARDLESLSRTAATKLRRDGRQIDCKEVSRSAESLAQALIATAHNGKITSLSVKEAKAKVCPLYPFC